MRCPNCLNDVAAGDTRCALCGHPLTSADAVPDDFHLSVDDGPAAPGPTGRYGAAISRKNPGCLVFLVDQSGSMDQPIANGAGAKKQVVADAINRLLYDTVLRCSKEDGVRPYFDVGVWTYGGEGEVRRAFDADLLSIRDVAERVARTETRRRRVPDGAGGVYEEEMELPIWFDPVADGATPMHAAFNEVVVPLTNWVRQHPRSFPPIVINLTDGAYSDETPAPVVRQLMDMGTADGTVLVLNCHITQHTGMTVPFPSDHQATGLSGLAHELFDISSPLPEPMLRRAQAKGYPVEPGARGYVFNADQVALIDFLDVGTRAIQDRVETN